jgi:DNA topoisomerase IB
MIYNNIHIKSKFYFNNGGKLDPDRFTIDGESILFVGNESGSMDVKFNRVAKIASKYNDIIRNLNKIITQSSGVPTSKNYNLAASMLLVIKTGIRIGNEDSAEGFFSDFKEKGKTHFARTYGLTTLRPNHVTVDKDVVKLDFTGKKHVENTFTLSKELSKVMIPIFQSGYNPVFGITDAELTKFIKEFTDSYLSSKDFRTFRANVYAYQKASELDKPTTKKEWKAAAKEVYEYTSKLLNNTPQVVKTSYIDPALLDYMWGSVDKVDLADKAKEQMKKNKKENKKELGGKFYFKKGGTTNRITFDVHGAAGENINSCRKLLKSGKSVFPGSLSVCKSQSKQHGKIKLK